MILSLEQAKAIVAETWLPTFSQRWGTSAMINDKKTTEWDWGWQFTCEPADPSRVSPENDRWPWRYVLVDRLTGNIELVGRSGPKFAFERLMQSREQKLNEMRGEQKPI